MVYIVFVTGCVQVSGQCISCSRDRCHTICRHIERYMVSESQTILKQYLDFVLHCWQHVQQDSSFFGNQAILKFKRSQIVTFLYLHLLAAIIFDFVSMIFQVPKL